MIPKSISDIVNWHKNAKYILGSIIAICAVLLWVATVHKVEDRMLWLSWLTVIALLFVAVMPVNGHFEKFHVVAAILARICITGLATCVCPIAIAVWAVYVGYTLFTGCQHKVLVAELCCIAEIIIMLIN